MQKNKWWGTRKWAALHKSTLIFNKAIYTSLLGLQVTCCFPKASAIELKSVDNVLTCYIKLSLEILWMRRMLQPWSERKRRQNFVQKWTKWHLIFSPDWLNYLEKKKEYTVSPNKKCIWLKYNIAHIGFARRAFQQTEHRKLRTDCLRKVFYIWGEWWFFFYFSFSE